jgi:hypothetical protein
MSDGQFVTLLAVIIVCTAYMANVVYQAAKRICEHVARSTNVLNETLNTVMPNEQSRRRNSS